jgi:hypothetical protein
MDKHFPSVRPPAGARSAIKGVTFKSIKHITFWAAHYIVSDQRWFWAKVSAEYSAEYSPETEYSVPPAETES